MGNHYVPRLVLRKYNKDEMICTFNVETGEYKENVSIEKAFQEKNFYDSETEKKLNLKIESQFGNLFSNKILKCGKTIELTDVERKIVKKFLLISVLRSLDANAFTRFERKMYDNREAIYLQYGVSESVAKELAEKMKPPFQEKEIDGETDFGYWIRTLNVVLDTDGSPLEIAKHPDATYVAHRWAKVINAGQIAFWDSPHFADEYVITDVGMTTENEIGWNGVTVHNIKKQIFVSSFIGSTSDSRLRDRCIELSDFLINLHENFMMFPISARRMIVLISPFFKFMNSIMNAGDTFVQMKKLFEERGLRTFELGFYSKMKRWELFAPNDAKYVHGWEAATGPEQKRDPNDLYIYKPVRLTAEEVDYCNRLFIDRIGKHIGFSSLDNVYRSILSYKKHLPRNNYSELYKIIEERYKLR